ncbi:hypothetical protein ACLBOM_30535 [Escherichia coli]
MVARGPGSLDVLRYVKSLGDSVRLVLGNHDLHLLAVFAGISRNKPKDRLTPLLEAPDADELLNWLRRQPLLQIDEEKVGDGPRRDHAAVGSTRRPPEFARDVEAVLSSDSYPFFLNAIYGDMPNNWSPELRGLGRLRFITNAFTPYAFLLSKRSTGYVQQRIAGRSPCPTETVVCDSWPCR